MHLKDKLTLRRQDDDPHKKPFWVKNGMSLECSTLATLTLIKLFVKFVETFNNFYFYFPKKNFFVKENKEFMRIFFF